MDELRESEELERAHQGFSVADIEYLRILWKCNSAYCLRNKSEDRSLEDYIQHKILKVQEVGEVLNSQICINNFLRVMPAFYRESKFFSKIVHFLMTNCLEKFQLSHKFLKRNRQILISNSNSNSNGTITKEMTLL
jgi:hypothetical protein